MKLKSIKIIFGIFSFSYIIYIFLVDLNKIKAMLLSIDGKIITGSFLCYLLSLLCSFYVTLLIINKNEFRLTLWQIAEVFLKSILYKYLPGGVWQSIGRLYLYSEYGVPKKTTLEAIFLEHIFGIISSILAGVGILIFLASPNNLITYFFTLIIILHPRNLKFIQKITYQAIFKVTKGKFQPEYQETILSIFSVLRISLLYFFAWTLLSSAFYFFIRSMNHGEISFLIVAASYLTAWSAGAIAIFSPQGVGVFEGVFLLLINTMHSIAIPISLVVSYRLFIFISDLLIWTLYISYSKIAKLV